MDISNKLYLSALKIRKNAYAPYSNFMVGASLLADNQQIYNGCNVENISFPCGTCAEAGAIASMISDGGKKILEILIIADSKKLITPCGACLQRIAEFSDNNTIIHLANLSWIQQTLRLQEMLPYGFNSEELKKW